MDRDADAFATIYRTHHPAVLKFLSNRTRDIWLAEDITSETFARAWKAIDRFEPRDGGMAAWLTRIARNILYDHASRGPGHHEFPRAQYDPMFEFADPDSRPDEVVMRMEARAAVRQAISRLPTDDQRMAMSYRHIDGLPIQEITERMGRHPTAVKSLCFRGVAGVTRQMSGQSSLMIDQ